MSDSPAAKTAEPTPAAAAKTEAKKDTTIDIPMLDLAEALNFISQIHEKALETLPMPKVAEGMGYAHPSSTPFYRRMVASRLFGLVGKSGAELSARARSYLKPDSEDARPRALVEAVTGIPGYAEEIQRYTGKRMAVQFVANSFATKLNLTDACATVCAKVFEASLRTAGLLGLDGTIGNQTTAKPTTQQQQPIQEQPAEQQAAAQTGGATRTHVLPLVSNRSVSVTAPLNMTKKEIDRVKRWLDVTLLIEEDDAGSATTPQA